jgi:hypothetical protein
MIAVLPREVLIVTIEIIAMEMLQEIEVTISVIGEIVLITVISITGRMIILVQVQTTAAAI